VTVLYEGIECLKSKTPVMDAVLLNKNWENVRLTESDLKQIDLVKNAFPVTAEGRAFMCDNTAILVNRYRSPESETSPMAKADALDRVKGWDSVVRRVSERLGCPSASRIPMFKFGSFDDAQTVKERVELAKWVSTRKSIGTSELAFGTERDDTQTEIVYRQGVVIKKKEPIISKCDAGQPSAPVQPEDAAILGTAATGNPAVGVVSYIVAAIISKFGGNSKSDCIIGWKELDDYCDLKETSATRTRRVIASPKTNEVLKEVSQWSAWTVSTTTTKRAEISECQSGFDNRPSKGMSV